MVTDCGLNWTTKPTKTPRLTQKCGTISRQQQLCFFVGSDYSRMQTGRKKNPSARLKFIAGITSLMLWFICYLQIEVMFDGCKNANISGAGITLHAAVRKRRGFDSSVKAKCNRYGSEDGTLRPGWRSFCQVKYRKHNSPVSFIEILDLTSHKCSFTASKNIFNLITFPSPNQLLLSWKPRAGNV